MPEPVMYIRGFPSSLLERSATSENMVEDLKAIASLSDEQVAGLRQRLNEAEGFLDPKALLATIREVVQDLKLAEAVRRAIRNINSSRVERIIAEMEQDTDDGEPSFDEATINRLKQVLDKLIQPYPALARFEKAKRLAKITGQPLETVELICDLRPIFDKNREKLEGMMPYTRLHIVATGEDGLPKPFEVELTYQQVLNLAEKAENAKIKLKVLRQSIETWLPSCLPDLPLTRIPPKESNDG